MDKLRKLLTAPETTVHRALKEMDEGAEKILFVTDKCRKLLGALSDGDIRRWILKGNSLDKKVEKVMNRAPQFLVEGYSIEEAKKIMALKKLDCLPVVDRNAQVVGVVTWRDCFGVKRKSLPALNIPVVIMAGGEGTRLAPFTKVLPKPLFPVGDQPIVSVIIDRFVACGCNRFFLSINYKADIIKAYFDGFKHSYTLRYLREARPLGTAGSLHLLEKKIKTPVFVTNCDVLIEADYSDIFKYHREQGNEITLVGSMKHYLIPYGVCDIEKGGALRGIREKPGYDFLVNTGFYILEPGVLADIPKNTVYHLTDLINDYLARGKKVGVYPISEKSWTDVGQWDAVKDLLK